MNTFFNYSVNDDYETPIEYSKKKTFIKLKKVKKKKYMFLIHHITNFIYF